MARLFDFPLLVTIYYGLVRRNLVYGTLLGTGLGLVQDALTHGFIGFLGMAKALVGYLAAAAGVRFDPERLLLRALLTGLLVLIHDLAVLGKLTGVVEKVDQHLAQAGHVAHDGGRRARGDLAVRCLQKNDKTVTLLPRRK
jgi:rod shape-determining protein MreD